MVNLTELALTFGVEIDDQATAEVVLYFDHVTGHLALRATDDLLRELIKRLLVLEGALSSTLKKLNGTLLRRLSAESNGKDVVLHRVE